jgi:hypothetical protein
MTIGEMVARVRAECPGFATVTHGYTSASDMPLPAALVAVSKIEAAPNQYVLAHVQRWRVTYSVWILMPRYQDGIVDAGQADLWDSLVGELRTALVAWTPDASEFGPLDFAGGMLDRYSGQIASWRDDYTTETFNRAF